MADRCSSMCPDDQPPAGMTLETAAAHPRYRHLVAKLGCELPAGHDGVHAAGSVRWHDPPRITVAGGRAPDPDAPDPLDRLDAIKLGDLVEREAEELPR